MEMGHERTKTCGRRAADTSDLWALCPVLPASCGDWGPCLSEYRIHRENTEIRASFSYVANKVRMSTREPGSVRIEERDGFDVLILRSAAEGYETRIYYYDGALREAYQASDQPLSPKLGEKLMELSGFRIEETDTGHLVLYTTDAKGNQRSLHLYIEGKTL